MKISVVTATFNSASLLPRLIESLIEQTYKNFEWVVIDGGSTDGTLDLIKDSAKQLDVKYISEPDFGIYDALNKGVKLSSTEFYLVIGSDDTLIKESLEHYVNAIDDKVDFITSSVRYGDKVLKVQHISSILSGAWSFVSCHSVGLLIRRSLHQQHGYYSRYFPIAADQLFIRKAIKGNAKVKVLDFIAGDFGQEGLSSSNVLGHITETFRVQYETEHLKFLQVILYITRLIKNKLLGRF